MADGVVTPIAEVRSYPEGWRPFLREGDLIRMALATGLKSLANANHIEPGTYHQAFFNLSTGLERLLKLIVLIDHALTNAGQFPSEDVLRDRFGHDLERLFAATEVIRQRLTEEGQEFDWGLVDTELVGRIIRVLAEYGKATRYYNLDYLVGARRLGRDPLNAWAEDVAVYLAPQYPLRLRAKDEAWAEILESALGEHSVFMQETETGLPIRSVTSAVMHGRLGEWVTKEATFHIATIVRYLTEILYVLNSRAWSGQVPELPALWEFFSVYNNSDKYLRGRKVFLVNPGRI